MRNLAEVIDDIVKIAPDLESVLHSVRNSVLYAAPEMHPYWWRVTADLLETYADEHPFREAIAAVFAGRTPS